MIEKIAVKNISESVVEQIEKLIEDGSFQSGEKLPSVRELCDMFGVGRSAIRDAIITLKGKGVVDVKQGEGAFVRHFDSTRIFNQQLISPSLKGVQELYEVRRIIEPSIAELAANRRDDTDVEKLRSILSDKTIETWELDLQFHLAIAEASKNEMMSQFIQFISSSTKKALKDLHASIREQQLSEQQIDDKHMAIFKAIQKGDAVAARKEMCEHLDFVREIMENRLS